MFKNVILAQDYTRRHSKEPDAQTFTENHHEHKSCKDRLMLLWLNWRFSIMRTIAVRNMHFQNCEQLLVNKVPSKT